MLIKNNNNSISMHKYTTHSYVEVQKYQFIYTQYRIAIIYQHLGATTVRKEKA